MMLLTGATGTVGRHVAAALTGRDDVRVLARTAEAAAALRTLGHRHVVRGDLAEPATLDGAFTGVDVLFLLTPAGPRQPELNAHALDAAEAAGVQRVVYQSLLDPGRPPRIALRAWHEPAEQRLAASWSAWAVLQPPVFTDNLLGQLDALRQGRLVWPGGDGALSHVDARDVAAVAVAALEDPGLRGLLRLTGPESLTFHEVAERVARHTGRSVSYVDATPDAYRAAVVGAGVDPVYADALVEGAAYYGSQPPLVDTRLVERVRGVPARPVDDLIRERLVPALAATG
jgi:uncharacterized protein YbjT (DUF2867 family)